MGLKEAGIWSEKVDKNSRRYVRLLGSGKIWSSPNPQTWGPTCWLWELGLACILTLRSPAIILIMASGVCSRMLCACCQNWSFLCRSRVGSVSILGA